MSLDGGTPLPTVFGEWWDGEAAEADVPAMGQVHAWRHEDKVLDQNRRLVFPPVSLVQVFVVDASTTGFVLVRHQR